jgi:hypothetical protein
MPRTTRAQHSSQLLTGANGLTVLEVALKFAGDKC